MGPNNSAAQSDAPNDSLTLQSTHSYFGSSTFVPNSANGDIQATVRDLHMQHVRQAGLLPTATPPRSPQKPVKLRSYLSVGSPDPGIAQVDGCLCVFFGLKAECPGRVLVIARNEISSLSFAVSERVAISMPLPEIDCFTVDITPNIENQPVQPGFDRVSKHVLFFDVIPRTPPTVSFVTQKLFVGDRGYVVTVNKPCEIQSKVDHPCLTCLTQQAELALTDCGHALICADCSSSRSVKLHHCPLCS
jgi:hypothetical protein